MIANEMNRASAMLDHRALDRARSAYEPLLALTDLTCAAQRHAADAGSCCAGVTWPPPYVSPTISPDAQRQAFRALLQLTPGSARQTPFLLGSA
jgi:hypothetical protein